MYSVEFLKQKVLEDNPSAEVRPGSAQHDLFIVPLDALMEPAEAQRAQIETAQRIANAASMTDEEADALAANFFVYRNVGGKASAQVQFFYAAAREVYIAAGTIVQSSDGSKVSGCDCKMRQYLLIKVEITIFAALNL